MVPITFRFIIPLTWCCRWLITSSWNLSTNVSWSSSTLWSLPGYQSDSWREIPCLPSKSCVIIGHFIAFPPTQTCSCFVLYLEFLATQHCSSLPWILPPFMSRMSWELHHLLRILGRWYFSPSPFFLGSSCWFQPGYQQVSGAVWILPF